MSVESGSDSSAEGENVREQPPRKYVPPIRPVGRGAYGIVCNLCNNKIGGNIPLSLPPNLEELLLSGNEINGLIPPSISSLSQIVAITLDRKKLIGIIPEAFQRLPRLERMYEKILQFFNHMLYQV